MERHPFPAPPSSRSCHPEHGEGDMPPGTPPPFTLHLSPFTLFPFYGLSAMLWTGDPAIPPRNAVLPFCRLMVYSSDPLSVASEA
jgi:hypothetical protein